jgi:hypothetical protein
MKNITKSLSLINKVVWLMLGENLPGPLETALLAHLHDQYPD